MLERPDYGSTFTANGYLVVRSFSEEFATLYQGLDDFQWPIELDEVGYSRFLRTIMGYPAYWEGVQVATDWTNTLAYFERCQAQGFSPRLLLVSTRYVVPSVVHPAGRWTRSGLGRAVPLGIP